MARGRRKDCYGHESLPRISFFDLKVMRILGIETSSFALGIGVIDSQLTTHNSQLFDYYINSGVPESENIIEIIRKRVPNLEEIDGIGVSIGPGSFTGLRVGLATAKGLGMGFKKPVIGVPTLDAFVVGIPFAQHKITPILDARNGNVYTASYEPNGKRITPYLAVNIEEFLDKLKGEHIFVGNGVKIYRDLIQKKLGKSIGFCERAHFISPNPDSPRGVWIASLALEYLRNGGEDAIDSKELELIYLSSSKSKRR